jgi:orotate phosphoribosyltransferase
MTYWLDLLDSMGCFWFDKTPSKFHALLSQGKHSNGYINLRSVIRFHPKFLKDMVLSFYTQHEKELLRVLNEEGIDYVHGPAMGGVIPAYELALLLGVGVIYTEKQDKEMICNFDELEGKKILLTEDILTTGGTSLKSKKVLVDMGAKIVGPLCVIINRSKKESLDDQNILSLIDINIDTYEPEECPWCKSGSEPVKPKLLWKNFSS